MDHQSRRDLFRATGVAGLGVVASRAVAASAITAQLAAAMEPQPNPSTMPADWTTADIIVETLIAWGVPISALLIRVCFFFAYTIYDIELISSDNHGDNNKFCFIIV